jgi:hypothetical protein
MIRKVITDDLVLKIYLESQENDIEMLAKKYGLSTTTILRIKNRQGKYDEIVSHYLENLDLENIIDLLKIIFESKNNIKFFSSINNMLIDIIHSEPSPDIVYENFDLRIEIKNPKSVEKNPRKTSKELYFKLLKHLEKYLLDKECFETFNMFEKYSEVQDLMIIFKFKNEKNRVFKIIFKSSLFAKIVYNCDVDESDVGFININFTKDKNNDFIHFYFSIEKDIITFNFLEEYDSEIEIFDIKIKKDQKWISIDDPRLN